MRRICIQEDNAVSLKQVVWSKNENGIRHSPWSLLNLPLLPAARLVRDEQVFYARNPKLIEMTVLDGSIQAAISGYISSNQQYMYEAPTRTEGGKDSPKYEWTIPKGTKTSEKTSPLKKGNRSSIYCDRLKA